MKYVDEYSYNNGGSELHVYQTPRLPTTVALFLYLAILVPYYSSSSIGQ